MSSSAQVRAFFQRFVLALLLVTVFTASGIGMAYWIAADKIDSAKTARFDPGTLAETQRGKPANFLIIGSDSRAFVKDATDESHFGDPAEQTGQRSDTIMIAHIDPDSHTGLLVSFPRDLWVQVPGLGRREAQRRVQRRSATRRRDDQAELRHPDQPLPGDRLRRIPEDRRCDRHGAHLLPDAGQGQGNRPADRHRRLPSPQRRAGAGVRTVARVPVRRIADGKWTTDGTADLGRIRRQQYFIRSLANEAVKSGFRNFTKVNSIIDKTVSNITRDPDLGLSDILALAKTFKEVDPGVVQMITVPTERKFINGQDSQVLVEDQAAPIFASLRVFGKQATADALPEGVVPADIHAQVLNGSGKGGQAGAGVRRAAGARVSRWWTRPATPTAATTRSPRSATRRVPKTRRKYALAYLGGAGKLVKVDTVPAGTNVVIVLGRDFEQVKAPATTVPDASTDDAHDASPGLPRTPAATRRCRPRAAEKPPPNIPAMHIAVIGAGYVGLTTAACFAHLGHDVICADIDEERVARLNKGEVPILEKGLPELISAGLTSHRLRFVTGATQRRARSRHRVPLRADAAGRRRCRRPVVRRSGRAGDRTGRCGPAPSS